MRSTVSLSAAKPPFEGHRQSAYSAKDTAIVAPTSSALSVPVSRILSVPVRRILITPLILGMRSGLTINEY